MNTENDPGMLYLVDAVVDNTGVRNGSKLRGFLESEDCGSGRESAIRVEDHSPSLDEAVGRLI